MIPIESERLLIIPFSPELMELALHDRTELKKTLNIDIPDNWPNADFAEYLPLLLEKFKKDPAREIWNGLIILRERRILIGDMGFHGGPDAEGTVEIGYGIVPQYHNQGYATEMAKALVSWAFEQRGMKRVIAECFDDNIGSIRVLEKLGMQRLEPEGNMLKWELRKED